jgi:glycosyltransferase-like protein
VKEIALLTYSTKPRGGVVHTLSLAEALIDLGVPAHVIALGEPGTGFYRPVRAPVTLIPAPAPLPTLDERVFASVDALEVGLTAMAGQFDILHSQDCISARAAARVREAGAGVTVVRTVHHVDDFITQALIDCQRQAILEPDHVLVVSEFWRQLLRQDYGVASEVVYNGVDADRFRRLDPLSRSQIRARIGADDETFVFLSVGGVEPRKGSTFLFEALSRLKTATGRRVVLAVMGGHSFQDYADYRERALASLPSLGLSLDDDVRLLGTVDDDEVPQWYAAADALAFPSLKEGWGLAVLEAMAAGLPVVTTDLPVFREYLVPDQDALLVPPENPKALAFAMARLVDDEELRRRLIARAPAVVERFSWPATARRHRDLYSRYAALPRPAIAPPVSR